MKFLKSFCTHSSMTSRIPTHDSTPLPIQDSRFQTKAAGLVAELQTRDFYQDRKCSRWRKELLNEKELSQQVSTPPLTRGGQYLGVAFCEFSVLRMTWTTLLFAGSCREKVENNSLKNFATPTTMTESSEKSGEEGKGLKEGQLTQQQPMNNVTRSTFWKL